MLYKINLTHNLSRVVFIALFLLCINNSKAQNFVFAQLTGSPVNTTGWNLQGAARVTNVTGTGNSEILLCPAQQNQSGAIFYNQAINLSLCITWTAEFDFRMFDGSQADGLAFCFLDVPPSGFVTGGGLGIPSTANGLKVCFDTYPNCPPQTYSVMPKLELRWGAGYNECPAQPTLDNSAGALSFVRSNTYNHAKITYNNGNINVYLNGSATPALTGFQQFTFTGYLGFTAGTGGSTDNHSIKNVVISTNMPPSVANAGATSTACQNTPLQIGTSNNPAYVYSWSPATGLSSTTVSNPTVTLPNANDTSAITKKYYVQTAFSNAVGCYSTDSVTVTIAPSLSAVSIITSAVASTICEGAPASFTAIPTNGGPAPSYLWKVNANKVGNNGSTFSSSSLANNDIVSCVMTSSAACLSVDTSISNPVFMTVNPSITPSISISASANNVCIGSPITFTAIPTDGGTSPIYQWQLNGATVGSNADTYTDSIFKNGDVVNCVLTSNSTACLATNTAISNKLTIALFPKASATVHIVVSANNICPDSSITVTATPITNGGSNPSYQWFVNAQDARASNQTYTSSSFKDGDTITCIMTSSNPCTAPALSNPIVMTVYPAPVIVLDATEVISFGGSIQLTPVISGNLAYHLWTPATGLNDTTTLSPTASPVNTATYQLDVATTDGCKASAKTTVTVYIPFQIPSAFTPNGDGKNDVFRIPPFIPLQINYFSVFDRWGKRVFTTTNATEGWDGTFNGTPQPDGAYEWIIEYKNLLVGRFVQQSGSVILIR